MPFATVSHNSGTACTSTDLLVTYRCFLVDDNKNRSCIGIKMTNTKIWHIFVDDMRKVCCSLQFIISLRKIFCITLMLQRRKLELNCGSFRLKLKLKRNIWRKSTVIFWYLYMCVLDAGAVSVVIDQCSFYMAHRYSFPVLLDNCCRGCVNNIVFSSSSQLKVCLPSSLPWYINVAEWLPAGPGSCRSGPFHCQMT